MVEFLPFELPIFRTAVISSAFSRAKNRDSPHESVFAEVGGVDLSHTTKTHYALTTNLLAPISARTSGAADIISTLLHSDRFACSGTFPSVLVVNRRKCMCGYCFLFLMFY